MIETLLTANPQDFSLLRRIALVESNFGLTTQVITDNPKGGIWQVWPTVVFLLHFIIGQRL